MIELTVGRSLRLAAERAPQRPAVSCRGETLTHGQLNALGNRVANGLLGTGLRKGDRIGVMLPNSIDYVVVGYAIAKSGLVMVPLNYRFTGTDLSYHLRDAQASALLYASDFAAAAAQAKGELAGLRTFAAGAPREGDESTLRELIDGGSDAEPAVDVAESDPFYLGYTSGTTGRPKGAIVSHRNRKLAYHFWAIEYGIGMHDVSLHAGPFHHSAPFGFTLAQLCLGGRVAVLPAFDAAEAMRTMHRERVTWAFMVPYMYNAILRLQEEDLRAFSPASLRILISAASPLPTSLKDRLLQAFPHAGLHEFYGATEAGLITNLRPEDQSRKLRCVGQPVPNVEIRLLAPDGSPVGPGEVGEIFIRSPTLLDGYFGAPEKTAAAFRDGWCTLGDLGRRDAEGYLYIVDRVKDVIKSGGVNVFPAEIEDVLLMHPALQEAAVVGIPDDKWGEAVHAIVVPRPGAELKVEEVLAFCRQALAGYKIPKSLEVRAELPRSPAGKVLKRLLRDEFWEGRSIRV